MRAKHFCLVLMTVTAVISSCGEAKTTEVVDKPKQEPKARVDTVIFPWVRKNMEMDSLPSTIKVSYAHISCPCAQWISKDNGLDDREYIYLEPANNKVTIAESFLDDYWGIQLKLTGRFYKQAGYPIGYDPGKGSPNPAKVFRYTKLQVIRLTPNK